MDNFQPNKKIMNLVDAISGRESNYGKNTTSKLSTQEGSFGTLQYTPARFNEDKAKYLPNMNLDINNPKDQKILKYAEVSNKIAQGWDMDRIVASHNAGDEGSKNWQSMKGVNRFGNKYDVPAYVADVKRRFKDLENPVDTGQNFLQSNAPTWQKFIIGGLQKANSFLSGVSNSLDWASKPILNTVYGKDYVDNSVLSRTQRAYTQANPITSKVGEIAGDIGQVAIGGFEGMAAKGAERVVPTVAKYSPTIAKVLPQAAKGVPWAIQSALQGSERGDSTGQIIKDSAISGVGGAIAEPLMKGAGNIVKKVVPHKTSQEIVQTITQAGSKAQPFLPRAEKALTSIDTKGVKTYSDLGKVLKSNIDSKVSQVDNILAKDTTLRKVNKTVDELAVKEISPAGRETSTNYIKQAVSGLKELYKKTGETGKLKDISVIEDRMKRFGLSLSEINQVARDWGSEFGQKAFNKTNGEALTSVNAQLYENIRKGVKSTVRQFLPDDTAKTLDSDISHLIGTKKLVDNMASKVQLAKGKTQTPNILQKGINKGLDIADKATLGSLSGIMRGIAKKAGMNSGAKVLSPVELESELLKNLKALSKKGSNSTVDFLTKNSSKKAQILPALINTINNKK